MKLKRKTIVDIYKTLSEFTGTYSKVFSMYIMLNNKKLKPVLEEIQILQQSTQPSDEYRNAQQRELNLLNEYVERDENNKPIRLGERSFKIQPEKLEEYNKLHSEMIEETKDIREEYEQVIRNVEALMEEEIEVELMEIPFESFPEEIEVEKLTALSDIIKDTGIGV